MRSKSFLFILYILMDLGPEIQKLLKDKTITNKTIDRVFIAKNYIEKKYQMKKLTEEERKKGMF